jgi:uncharacterized protein YbjT (DUF2867 family)
MNHLHQITVFGATGFIGRHAVRRLAKTGAYIRVPTRNPEKALELKPMGDVGQIVPLKCVVRSDASVAWAIGSSDAVVNLIGILYEKGRDTFQAMHVETAARIARLARDQGATHFVHLSALGADPASKSSYARSKAAGEQAVRTFFPDAVILRPSVVFGPEDHFFNMFASFARFSPVLPLIGGGHTRFQPVYVGDVAEAIMQTLTRMEAQDCLYELGGPIIYTFREMLDLMLQVICRKRKLIEIPWFLAKIQAAFLGLMPHPMLTRDQVELLKTDNIVHDPRAKTLRDLGIMPTAAELILPTYLERFRRVDPASAPDYQKGW